MKLTNVHATTVGFVIAGCVERFAVRTQIRPELFAWVVMSPVTMALVRLSSGSGSLHDAMSSRVSRAGMQLSRDLRCRSGG